MSTLIRFPVTHENIVGYRFGRAELQITSERLLIAGVEVALSSMAYRFLLGLCRTRGALLTRADAFDLLWPGGGSGSDEALAQIVLKVRQSLASEGRAIVTVRGRGFRLELPVETLLVKPLALVNAQDSQANDISIGAPTELATTPTPNPSPSAFDMSLSNARISRLRWPLWFLCGAIAVLALIVMTHWFTAPGVDLDGFAVRAEAFGPISAQGADTLRTVMLRENEGDRTSARQLLKTLVDSEPHSAAPAFLLRLWLGGSAEEMLHSQHLVQERLPHEASAYVQLLSRWVAIAGKAPGDESEMLSAALKLQPSAWRLSLARAHVSLRLLRFDEALVDLRRIPLSRLAPRYAMFVMSDRASLGDAAAMQVELPQLAQRAPAIAGYVRGRIALARDGWADAQTAFEAAAKSAEREALTGSVNASWLLAAVAAGAQNQWEDMQGDADQARRIGIDHNLGFLVTDAEVLIGYAQYRRGFDDQGDASWDRASVAFHDANDSGASARLWLQRARLQPGWGSANATPELTDSTLPPGLPSLLTARKAWLACAMDVAKHALAVSESAGIDTSYFAGETELLRQDLGIKRHAAAATPQLPYPELTRWITYWESDRSAGARACTATAEIK